MDAVPAAVRQARTDMAADFDAIVIGAGISGFYQLYKLRELGQRRASTATGSRAWLRSPCARFASTSFLTMRRLR